MLFAFSANAVFTSFLDFVSGDAAAIFDVVFNFSHTQVEQIIASNFLAIRFVIGVECTTVIGFVFVLDVVATLRGCPHRQQHRQANANFYECFHAALPSQIRTA
jgi:hypothetical protein